MPSLAGPDRGGRSMPPTRHGLRAPALVIVGVVGAAMACALALAVPSRGGPIEPPSATARATPSATWPGLASAPPVAARETFPRAPRVVLERSALNLLLLPLVDDSTPPRWQAFGTDWVCGGGGEVSVDGRPLVDGEALPAKAFELRWTLHRCPPLADADLLVDGTVTVTVFHDDDGLSAVVEPRLRTLEGGVEGAITRTFVTVEPIHVADTR